MNLPWREDAALFQHRVRRFTCLRYTALLIRGGWIDREQAADMVKGLDRAWLFWEFGLAIEEKIREQSEQRDPEGLLKTQARARPKKYAQKGLIAVMAIVWTHFGHYAGTASGEDESARRSPFQRFVDDFLHLISPRAHVPSRSAYRRALCGQKSKSL